MVYNTKSEISYKKSLQKHEIDSGAAYRKWFIGYALVHDANNSLRQKNTVLTML
jgi:hypothetical protein